MLDGFSRMVVRHDLRESMTELAVEIVCHRAPEKYEGVTPRIISDTSPQIIAGDFQSFIRQNNMTRVRTSPYYPQSNGKLERWHGSLKQGCVGPSCPRDAAEAIDKIDVYVVHCNKERLHSGIGYITRADRLAGRSKEIHDRRGKQIVAARARRKTEANAVRQAA